MKTKDAKIDFYEKSTNSLKNEEIPAKKSGIRKRSDSIFLSSGQIFRT